MISSIEPPQRVARLAPLSDVHAALQRLAGRVSPVACDVRAAANRVLGVDLVAPVASPAVPLALRDGWAVASDSVTDASSYAPVPLRRPHWVDSGEPMPADTDAVLPLDCVTATSGRQEAIAPVAFGDGVLAAAADARQRQVLRRAGERLRISDVAVTQLLGCEQAHVCVPRIAVIAPKAALSADGDAIAPFLMAAIDAQGGVAHRVVVDAVEGAFAHALTGCEADDAVITIGGTGSGRSDRAVHALAEVGHVAMHGMAIAPGETAALGAIANRPVLMLPGRLDATLAVWLLVGRPLLEHLTGALPVIAHRKCVLTRKIASTLGMTEVVLVRLTPDGAQPLASRHFPLSAITHADGWVVVPPQSEGFPPGALIAVHSLP